MSERIEIMSVYNPQHFKALLEAVGTIAEEVNVKATYEGLRILTMDTSHVAMVDLQLPARYFDSWKVTNSADTPLIFSMNIKNTIKNAIPKVTKKDAVSLSLVSTSKTADGAPCDHAPEWVVTGKFNTQTKHRMPYLEPTDDEVPEPKLFFKAKARILTEALNVAIQNIASSEHVKLTIDDELDTDANYRIPRLTVSAAGYAGAQEETQFRKGDDAVVEIRKEEDTHATYTLSILQAILKKAGKASEVTTLELTTDTPLKIDAELPLGTLVYHLAPCIGV